MWTIAEQKMKKANPFNGLLTKFAESKLYVDLCWFDEQYLCVATVGGDLLIIYQFDVIQTLEDVAPSKIVKIRAFETGLVVACEKGELLIF